MNKILIPEWLTNFIQGFRSLDWYQTQSWLALDAWEYCCATLDRLRPSLLLSRVPKVSTSLVRVSRCTDRMHRWYIKHNKVGKAFRSFQRLRYTNIQAARDTYYTYIGVELEREANKGKNLFTQFFELFTVPRNRRATLATWIVMFGQQVRYQSVDRLRGGEI